MYASKKQEQEYDKTSKKSRIPLKLPSPAYLVPDHLKLMVGLHARQPGAVLFAPASVFPRRLEREDEESIQGKGDTGDRLEGAHYSASFLARPAVVERRDASGVAVRVEGLLHQPRSRHFQVKHTLLLRRVARASGKKGDSITCVKILCVDFKRK